MATSFIDATQAVRDYYGADKDIWIKLWERPGQLTPDELRTIQNTPGVNVTVTNSGKFAGIDYDYPFPETPSSASPINSNTQRPTYGSSSFNGRVNGTYQWDGQTSRLTSGARRVSTGTRVATVAGKINVATTAVAAGMLLGAKIDGALYKAGKFFDLNPPESLNPETWDSIASTEFGKSVIRHLFDIGDDGATMYMPEDAIEYMYKYWNDLSAFGGEGAGNYSYDGSTTGFPDPTINTIYTCNGIETSTELYEPYDGSIMVAFFTNAPNTSVGFTFFGRTSASIKRTNKSTGESTILTSVRTSTTVNNTSFKYQTTGAQNINNIVSIAGSVMPYTLQGSTAAGRQQIGTFLFDGTYHPPTPAIDGVSRDPNASEYPDPSQIDTSQPILPQLKQQMPNTFRDPIKESVPQPDGTTKDIIYYPVPFPKITDDTDKPTSGTKDQNDPTVTPDDPSDETDPIRDVITNPLPQPEIPTPGGPATPPDTGSGSTPTVTPPTGTASSLWAVYNPTQAQLDAFGSWLWSSDFVEQIKKLFNDPMQAIVGVHKVFATPSTGGQQNIKCGYIDSGCPAAVVTSQYTTINCGTVNVREYYGNVFDYSPYTSVSLYLPFIGIVKLDVSDVMRGSVTVIYHVDVITGACLADVKVSRDGENAVLYQYSGSAIVSYPISSGSYASMVSGVLSLAAGVAGSIMTGGAAAPALIGGAVGLSHLHTDVQKSGGFSGSPGAMGCKKPYLIICRAQDALPTDFPEYEGKPASKTVKISSCDGFIRIGAVNLEGIPATDEEIDQIKQLLMQGVIV